MKELVFPRKLESKLEKYITLSDADKSQIIDCLNNLPSGLTPRELINQIHSNTNGLDKQDVRDVVIAYLNLIDAKSSFGTSIENFTPILENALLETNIPELKPTEKVLSDLKGLLSSGENVAKYIRVNSLMSESSCVFLDAKIYQDIRPSFDENGSIEGSGIIHRLRLVVKEKKESNEIYISLDDDDLISLQNEIKIAQENAKLIKSALPNAKIIDQHE